MRRIGRGAVGGAILAGAFLVVGGLAAPAAAQVGGDGYLFRTPVVTLGFKAGYAMPRAGSEIFAFTQDELTLSRSDFDGTALGGDIGVRIAPRMDLLLSVSYSGSETQSEFRDWVDTNDRPIEQVTTFTRIPVTVGLKGYLRERGRSVGSLAWVPARWNAFGGAAAGFTWYEFQQRGDFVDFETLDIFSDIFHDEGRAPTLQLFGGLEYSLSPTFLLSAEGRYGFASSEMGTDFVDFDPMDLAGFQATLGLSARF